MASQPAHDTGCDALLDPTEDDALWSLDPPEPDTEADIDDWEPESEADTDTEPESDPDGPDESDADAEPDTDTEAEPDCEPEPEPDGPDEPEGVEPESDHEPEPDFDPESDADTEPESDLEADPESDAEPDPDPETDRESEADCEPESDFETDADMEPESLADMLSEPDEPLGPEAEEWESDHDRDPESDAEPDCDPEEALWSLDPLEPDTEAEPEPDEPESEEPEPESESESELPLPDSLTEEYDLLEPQNDIVVHRLFIGVGAPDKSLIRLELPAGTGREAVAAEALADARQAEDKPHRLVRPLLCKLHVDLAPVDGRADQYGTIGDAPADLDAVRLAYLQKPLVDRQFGVFLGNGRLENIVEPDFRRFQYKERGIAALGPTGRHDGR